MAQIKHEKSVQRLRVGKQNQQRLHAANVHERGGKMRKYDKVLKDYKSGLTVKEVAVKYGLKIWQVQEVLANKRIRFSGTQTSVNANICFDCAKAGGGCSWSAVVADGKTLLFQPVEGWTAKPTKMNVRKDNGDTREIETYHITACPEFVRG